MATSAPTATSARAPTSTASADQGGSKPRPALALRRLATWGDGVPAALALSPDGAALYVATALGLARRDAGEFARVAWAVPLDEPPAALALSPDGVTLAVAIGPTVELRAAADGALRDTLRHSTAVADVAFAPDGATLAAALAGEALAIWNVADLTLERELRLGTDTPLAIPSALTSVAFSPDGGLVAAGDSGGNVIVWAPARGDQVSAASVGLRVVSDVAFAPDGATVAAASEGWRAEAGAVWLFDSASGAERGRLTIEDGARQLEPIKRVAFSADGASVVAGSAAGAVVRWSWPDGALLGELPAHHAAVTALAPTLGGGLLTAGRDGDLRRWNADDARVDELAGLAAVGAVAATATMVVTGGEDGAISLWSRAGEPMMTVAAHSGAVNALAISPDGALLASGGDDGAVRLWHLPGGDPLAELPGHDGPVLALAFAPGGTLLASAGWDGAVNLWTPDGPAPSRIEAIASDGLSPTVVLGVACDPAGRTVTATAYDGALRRFPARGGAPLEPLLTGAGGWLIAVAITSAGRTAALDDGGLLWAWDAQGQVLGSAALADATGLVALSDGRLLTAGAAGGLRLWRLDGAGPAELAAAASVGDSVAASPDGRIATVGSRRGFVEVWGLP